MFVSLSITLKTFNFLTLWPEPQLQGAKGGGGAPQTQTLPPPPKPNATIVKENSGKYCNRPPS